jgi:DnaJ family protein C protein 9
MARVTKSLYDVLGVPKSATASQIKKAYFKGALLCHPDKNPNDPNAKEAFQELSQAHSILSDAEKKHVYDETGMIDDQDCSGGDEGSMDQSHWEEHFRRQFPSVTMEKIEAFALQYRGSDEERGHILAAYLELDGALFVILSSFKRFESKLLV